jgi:hypothetical protein
MRRIRDIGLRIAGLLVLGVTLGALAAGMAQAKSVIVLPRPGQVGVSVGGLYGTLLQSGNVGAQFGSGPGMMVQMRYRMRYERGIGLSFESHGFDPRAGETQTDFWDDSTMPADSATAYKKLNVYLYGVDFYQMFGTRTKTTTMLSVGAGLAHSVFDLNDGEQQFPFNDGAYLSAGVGAERFVWQSVAIDLGARYHAVFLDGKVNHDLRFSAGLIMYASR